MLFKGQLYLFYNQLSVLLYNQSWSNVTMAPTNITFVKIRKRTLSCCVIYIYKYIDMSSFYLLFISLLFSRLQATQGKEPCLFCSLLYSCMSSILIKWDSDINASILCIHMYTHIYIHSHICVQYRYRHILHIYTYYIYVYITNNIYIYIHTYTHIYLLVCLFQPHT